MKTYRIVPGIAALVHVYCEDFDDNYGAKRASFIYLAAGKPVESGDPSIARFEHLPAQVQSSIDEHFLRVFELPVGQRGEYLSNVTEWEVEA